MCYHSGASNQKGAIMIEITMRALALAATYSFLLFGVALLAGCSAGKYVFACTVTQPENCN